MKKYIKLYVPLIYIGVVILMVVSTMSVMNAVRKYLRDDSKYSYTLDNVFEGDIVPVMKSEVDMIVRPYIDENVKVGKYFYDYESDSTKQENSLILYENVYMQNTGVDYISSEDFDVVSILDGEIISIDDSEVYGKIISIKHNDNLISTYSNISNINFDIGYKVNQGEIIGTSKVSDISDGKSMLHFEVSFKGDYIDPENLYTLKVSEIQ